MSGGEEKQLTVLQKASANAWAAVLGGTIHGLIELPIVVPIEASITQTQINAKTFVWNFKDLLKKGQLYRSLGTTAAGLIPKCWVMLLLCAHRIQLKLCNWMSYRS